MTLDIIPITSREQWHAERAKDVTSTQVAALFDASPYLTHLELWHQKANGYFEEFVADDRVRWGDRLEAAIADGVAEELNLAGMAKANFYHRDTALRLGASFDFEAQDDNGQRVLVEVKNVDAWEFREKWNGEGDSLMAPPHIELQVQTQLMLRWSARYAIIAVLVGGNTLHTLRRERDDELAEEIRNRVFAFWRSVEAHQPPPADYVRDADLLLSHVYSRTDGREIEADAAIEGMVEQWLKAKAAAELVRPLQAHIAEMVGTASRVRLPAGLLSCAANKNGVRSFRYYPAKEIAQ
jgi:predicted phage-related endonuclease